MTNEETLLLEKFKHTVRSLQNKCEKLQEKNEQLALRVQKLEDEVLDVSYSKKMLERDYDSLKVAGMMSMNDEDKELTRNRINKMVREIDKCIAQLNV
ncbi:MAG: hypothetical protein ACK5JS_02890 [Mangrovibacterium sp.]